MKGNVGDACFSVYLDRPVARFEKISLVNVSKKKEAIALLFANF